MRLAWLWVEHVDTFAWWESVLGAVVIGLIVVVLLRIIWMLG